jgi:hypothetical protein
MSDLSERLKRDAAALDCDEEHTILASGLLDLEEDLVGNPGALDPRLVPVRRNKPSR